MVIHPDYHIYLKEIVIISYPFISIALYLHNKKIYFCLRTECAQEIRMRIALCAMRTGFMRMMRMSDQKNDLSRPTM